MNGPSTHTKQERNAASDAFETLAHPAVGLAADSALSELVAPFTTAARAACRVFIADPIAQAEAREYVDSRNAQVGVDTTRSVNELANASMPSPKHVLLQAKFDAAEEAISREMGYTLAA